MSLTIKCDVSKCDSKPTEIQHEYQLPKGWNKAQLTISKTDINKHFHICPEHTKVFGLEELKTNINPAQALLDIIYEIAQEAVDDNRQ